MVTTSKRLRSVFHVIVRSIPQLMKLQIVARYLLTMFASAQFITDAAATPTENSLLWEIRSPKGAVSHVFGTIHVADSNVFRQRDTVLALLDRSETFHAELNIDSMFAMQDPTLMMMPAGKTLRSYFSDEEVAEIRAALKERFGPMGLAMEGLKPAAIAVMLSIEEAENSLGLSVDQFLWQRATKAGLKRFGIERISEQMALIDSIPPKLLLDVIRGTDALGPSVNVLTEAYAGEQLEEISTLIDSVSSVESFMQRLNDDRNVIMVERLRPYLDNGKAFIAVGTAHLAGSQGILEGMRKAGYAVRPITAGSRIQWLDAPPPTRR